MPSPRRSAFRISVRRDVAPRRQHVPRLWVSWACSLLPVWWDCHPHIAAVQSGPQESLSGLQVQAVCHGGEGSKAPCDGQLRGSGSGGAGSPLCGSDRGCGSDKLSPVCAFQRPRLWNDESCIRLAAAMTLSCALGVPVLYLHAPWLLRDPGPATPLLCAEKRLGKLTRLLRAQKERKAGRFAPLLLL